MRMHTEGVEDIPTPPAVTIGGSLYWRPLAAAEEALGDGRPPCSLQVMHIDNRKEWGP